MHVFVSERVYKKVRECACVCELEKKDERQKSTV